MPQSTHAVFWQFSYTTPSDPILCPTCDGPFFSRTKRFPFPPAKTIFLPSAPTVHVPHLPPSTQYRRDSLPLLQGCVFYSPPRAKEPPSAAPKIIPLRSLTVRNKDGPLFSLFSWRKPLPPFSNRNSFGFSPFRMVLKHLYDICAFMLYSLP